MRSKDYSKEIGYQTEQKMVPLPVGIAVIAVILLGGSAALYATHPHEKEAGLKKSTSVAAVAEAPAK